jgi:hypothetical protein
MTTLHDLTHPVSKLLLPCGVEVSYHKLYNKDYQLCLKQYGFLVEAMAIVLDTPEPSIDDVRRMMPGILMEVYNSFGTGKTAIEDFLAVFSDDLTPELITEFSYSEFEEVWRVIYENNKIPFEMRLRSLSGQALKLAIETYRTLTEMGLSSSPVSEPESTPLTPISPSNTSGAALKSKSSTK